MTKDEIIQYWLDSATADEKVMNSLFENGHYTWTLFIGHLVIEKTLKALYVKDIDVKHPMTHDLLQIVRDTSVVLTEEQRTFLDTLTAFNIRARYPDYKQQFFRKASKEYTGDYAKKIKEFKEWIILKIVNQ